jgi:uncharacterized delta-60 repeat protein
MKRTDRFGTRQMKDRTDGAITGYKTLKLFIFGAGICVCLQYQAGARPGDLDTTFGTNGTGKVVTPILPPSDFDPTGFAVQRDGKFIVANQDKVVGRFNSDGRLDQTFASQGILNVPGNGSSCNGLIVDAKDRLLILGARSAGTYLPTFFWISRFRPDGVVDTSFGSAGEVAVEMGEFAIAEEAVVQPDEKIIVTGLLRNHVNNEPKGYFAVIRCTSTGALDPTFGTAGRAITDLGTWWDESKGVVLQPDGKIVVAGYSGYQQGAQELYGFAVVRYTTNGALDTTFNGTGKAFFPFGAGTLATSVALQPDGKILVGGYAYFQYGYLLTAMGLARFNTDGSVDTSFGVNGQVTHHEGNFAGWYKILAQPDGKIVVCGNSANSPELYVGRYLTNGNPDPSFGSSTLSRVGIAAISTGTRVSLVNHMALLPNGKLLITGAAHDTNSPYSANIVVARLENDGVAFPVITCPPPIVANCGESATLTASIADLSGLPLTAIWIVNGEPVQTNSLPGADSGTNFVVTLSQVYPIGTNEVGLTVTDSLTNSTSCSTSVSVIDHLPPIISSATVEPSNLWPPDRKLVAVNVSATVADNCDNVVAWKIVQVSSNQESDERAPDWIITGQHSVLLRAERSHASERVYTITIQASDSSDNVSELQDVTVTVSEGAGQKAITTNEH